MKNFYLCFMLLSYFSFSLLAMNHEIIVIAGQQYKCIWERKAIDEFLQSEDLKGWSEDAKAQLLLSNQAIKKIDKVEHPTSSMEKDLNKLKEQYIQAYRKGNQIQQNKLENTLVQSGVSDLEICELEREAYLGLNPIENNTHTFSTCDNLQLMVELAGPDVVILLDADDTTFYRNEYDFFVPLQDDTIENINNMRRKGARVLIVTGRSLDTIEEVFKRMRQANIPFESNLTGLFHGKLKEKFERNGTACRAGSHNGVIAVSGGFTKGEIIVDLIERSPQFFNGVRTIVFVDDCEGNCRSVYEALSRTRFTSSVFHFTNAEHMMKVHYDGRVYKTASPLAANPDELKAMIELDIKDVSEYRRLVSEAAQVGMQLGDYLKTINKPAVSSPTKEDCQICLEECEKFMKTNCNNTIVCNQCIVQYYKEMVPNEGYDYDPTDGNTFKVLCPGCRQSECFLKVDKETIKALLGNDMYNNLKERATRHITDMKSCPHERCLGVYLASDATDAAKEGNLYITCVSCEKNICTSCEKPYLNSQHRCDAKEIVAMPYGDDFKPCPNPNCKCAIEKNGGCLVMVCGGNPDNPRQSIVPGHCGATFCWACGVWIPAESKGPKLINAPSAELYKPKSEERAEPHGAKNAYQCKHEGQWWKKE